ncbi:hypothetical protein EW145_g1659 [Phellinidium pouzarii]|uniref:SHSP domain-containing protein n=1 Tax=Phellinidium pouzarii TaxID=167371 RepID=A0A4S4LJ75_9AGAM|nr:hypothetical protein EW145_g1659 [Phellinidium pouzarii]
MSSFYYYEPFFSINDFHRLFEDTGVSRSAQRSRRSDADQHSELQSRSRSGFQPRMDIIESPEANLLTATIELPGLKKENIAIDVHNNRLIVSGERTLGTDVNEEGFIHRERQTGRFSRALPLPTGTQTNEIKASMEDGVLTIIFPKTSPEQAPKKIDIV